MGRTCSTYGEKMNTYRVLVGNQEGKSQLGNSRRRWKHDIKSLARTIPFIRHRSLRNKIIKRDTWTQTVRTSVDLHFISSKQGK